MVKIFDIASSLVVGNLYRVIPNVYALEIADKYDRAMLFCKYQEFYESPMTHIRGKYFTLEEFMRAYKDYRKEECFTYPQDWEGYNIPSEVLDKAVDTFQNDSDNDRMMEQVYMICEADSGGRFYLIGVDNIQSATYKHEMAHALWYTDKKYKTKTKRLLKKIDRELYGRFEKKLLKMGYPEIVHEDEIQAYLCHGWRTPHHSQVFRDNLNYFLNQ
jgi:hypothetical protein